MEEKKDRPLYRPPLIPRGIEISTDKAPESDTSSTHPNIDIEAIKDWDLTRVIRGVNITLDKQSLLPYVAALKQAKEPEEFAAIVDKTDTEIAERLHMDFATRMQAARRRGAVDVPQTPSAVSQDLQLTYAMGRIYMQYVMESIFANFDEKKWEEEFLRERGKKIYETLGKHYTLTDFFGKKCREALDVEPLATFIRFLESRHVTPSREGLIFELIKNFDDGVFHIPHLQKLATSDEDLKKRIRLLMHTNSGSRLYTKLLNAAEGHSYFWKSLRELLADSPSFTDQELKLACESGVLANARGEMPTGTCPVHHLPQETFDGIIDLMVKYPESSANQ